MGGSIIVHGLVALGCCLIVQTLLAQNTATETSATVYGVLYRCVLATGDVEYPNVPKADCVVVSTYVAKPKQEGAQSNPPARLIEQGGYVNRSAQCRDDSYSSLGLSRNGSFFKA